MKIEILCGQGSPEGVHLSDIYGENGRVGVGGAELALLTMCEAWTKAGHEVVLYNNPKRQDGVFEQRMARDFVPKSDRDVFIIFRQPTQKIMGARGKKIFWSCDPYTIGDFRHFAQFCDSVVTISDFHAQDLAKRYEIRETVTIDLPVRIQDYEQKVEKVENRLIFTSVPDRGLWQVLDIFPHIRDVIPDVSLVITSDYRLWGSMSPNNTEFMQRFMRQGNVEFLGAVPRKRLVEEQLKAQIHLYPCIFEELFCISVAESQVAGTLPITTSIGALSTTNMGVIIDGDAKDLATKQMFVNKVVEYLNSKNLVALQEQVRQNAIKRFSVDNIVRQWDERIFNAG